MDHKKALGAQAGVPNLVFRINLLDGHENKTALSL